MRIKDREAFFMAGRDVNASLGGIAQNDMEVTQADIEWEVSQVDALIERAKAYRQMVLELQEL